MDFLLDNPLAAMDAVPFLLLYAFAILTSIAGLAYFKSSLDRSDRLGTPAIPPRVDPFETAYLRGGPNELARTVVFSLRQKGQVEFVTAANQTYLSRMPDASAVGLNDIERRALEWVGRDRDVRNVFIGGSPLVDALAAFHLAYQGSLEARNFLLPADYREKLSRWRWTAIVLIGALGVYKVLATIAAGNFNVVFTVLFGAVGIAALLSVGSDRFRTKLGERYLERLQIVFQGLKGQAANAVTSVAAATTTADSLEPLLVSVGVFGGVALAGTAYYDHNEAFEKSKKDERSGGGCGGFAGCGSAGTPGGDPCDGGSGCGGSGCSSGGSCGGGGCGGGGCGS